MIDVISTTVLVTTITDGWEQCLLTNGSLNDLTHPLHIDRELGLLKDRREDGHRPRLLVRLSDWKEQYLRKRRSSNCRIDLGTAPQMDRTQM
jgi:hypothetical protein